MREAPSGASSVFGSLCGVRMKRIQNMTQETRLLLAGDLQEWSGSLFVSQLKLMGLMHERYPHRLGNNNRAIRLKQWFARYGLCSPVSTIEYVPPDLAHKRSVEGPTPHGAPIPPGPEAEPSQRPKMTAEQADENHYQISAEGTSVIMSAEELVRISGLDTNIWRIERHEVNTWTTALKLSERIGTDPTGRPIVENVARLINNWQVKIWCERRIDAGMRLPTIGVVRSTEIKPRSDGRKTAILIPDPQIGFRRRNGSLLPLHDRRALDLAVQIASYVRPDSVVFLGDNLDLAELSETYPCPAEMVDTAGPALAEMRYWLARIRASIPDSSEIIVLEGNHGDRLRRLLKRRLAGMADIVAPGDSRPAMDLGRMLGVDEFGARYVAPYMSSVWLWGAVEVTHGDVVRAKSGATVSAVVESASSSQVFGHVHRVEVAHRTLWGENGPRTIFAATPGCMCRIVDGIVPGAKPRNNWQQGIGIATYDIDARQESIVVPTIHRGKIWVDGQRFEALDPTSEIERIVGWRLAHDWLLEGE